MKIKSIVFIHKDENVIPVPYETEVKGGYEEAHDLFKRSNIPHYMFLIESEKSEKKEETK